MEKNEAMILVKLVAHLNAVVALVAVVGGIAEDYDKILVKTGQMILTLSAVVPIEFGLALDREFDVGIGAAAVVVVGYSQQRQPQQQQHLSTTVLS